MQLTADQERAVRSWEQGDVCVVAGPGSGKTRVLVERLRWLILERQVPAEHVLAITFTEKAAHEMRSRLLEHKEVPAEKRAEFQAAQVSTIDAFCNRLLKEHALSAGIDPGFEILDETESAELLEIAIDEVLGKRFARGGPALEQFLSSYLPGQAMAGQGDSFGLRRDLVEVVRRIRSHGCEPTLTEPRVPVADLARCLRELAAAKDREELLGLADRLDAVRQRDVSELASLLAEVKAATEPLQKRGKNKELIIDTRDTLLPACRAAAVSAVNRPARQWLLATVRRILQRFEAAKREAGRLDFDDVLAKSAELLASGVRLGTRFEHVLIDEFQDTNPLQVQLVERLLDAHGQQRPARFVVGDINQSIYAFRHADQNVFRQYRQAVEKRSGEVIRLMENFRSRPDILEAVHGVLPGGGESGVEPHRLRSASSFPEKLAPSVEVLVVSEGGEQELEREAAWLACRLQALRQELRIRADDGTRMLDWCDVAILTRTNDRATRLARALRGFGVPSETGGGRGLFRAPQTAELAAFLRVLRNPRDEVSLAAVLKSPFCGIDDAALFRLTMGRENLAEAVTDGTAPLAGLDAGSNRRLGRLGALLGQCRNDCATVPVRSLLARATSAIGYRSFLAAQDDGPRAVANLDLLLDWIGRREEQGATGLDAISETLDQALAGRLPAKEAPDPGGTRQAVEVLTMHAAKGLEYPVVVLASVQSPTRPTVTGLRFSEQHGLGACWREPFGGEPEPDAAYRSVQDGENMRKKEEFDRLLYVAMTRAQEHLVLSASFGGKPKHSSWCIPIFEHFSINTKESPTGAVEERQAGNLRFLFCSASADPPASQQGPAAARGPKILHPLAAAAQPDGSAPVTSVALFGHCPRKYFLSRYLGLEDGVRLAESRSGQGGNDARQIGSAVHSFLAGETDEVTPEIRRIAAAFQEHELGLRAARAERVEKEAGYTFPVGGGILRGKIDLLFEEGGERILVDYKTDRGSRDEIKESARVYFPQVQLYAAGLAGSGKPADRAVLFYLRQVLPVEVEIGEDALKRTEKLVADFFEAQARQEFPLRTGEHCRNCWHYRRECPARLG